MSRVLAASLLCLALTGCGEVVVFGHVVRENPAKTEAAGASDPATEPASPEAATEASAADRSTDAAQTQLTTETAVLEPATDAVASTAAAVATSATGAAVAAPATAATATVSSSAQATRQTAAPAASGLPATTLLHAVNVTLSDASQAGDANVDAAALLDAIRAELRSRQLLDEQNPSAHGTAKVLIESAATHRTVNAVLFGSQPMAGTLTGELRVSGVTGEELAISRIVAESRFSIPQDGQNRNSLAPLYRRFAVLTADELTAMAASSKSHRTP